MHYQSIPSVTLVVVFVVVVIVVLLTHIPTYIIQHQQQQYQYYSYYYFPYYYVDSFSIQRQRHQHQHQHQHQHHHQQFRYYQSKLYSNTIVQTTIPPLFDSPVFSLATLCDNDDNDGDDDENNNSDKDNELDLNQQPKQQKQRRRKTNMNIITYATPVSFSPERIWVLGLYKPTLTYKNFISTKFGILQILCTDHIPIIPILGGCSGSMYNKQQLCSNYTNCTWIPSSSTSLLSFVNTNSSTITGRSTKDDDTNESSIMILPNCAYYMQLQCLNIIDAGGHDIAVCKVLSMHTSTSIIDDDNNIDDGTISHVKPSNHLSTKLLRDLGIITEQGRVADMYRPDSMKTIDKL